MRAYGLKSIITALILAVLWISAASTAATNSASPALPQYADEKHLGVASCSNSLCHGSASERHTTPVLQNEYLIWQRQDAHSDAFATLKTPEALAITHKLGLGKPITESLCLDCHTDNPAPAQRGGKFLLSDGIGCEACHGGAENWLANHTAPETTHADNLAAGMYPTADPQARVALCQSCHVGHPKKPMRHKLLGVGHPPLLFELDTYTANLPPHFQVDADYKQRKPTYTHLDWWAQGQISAAQATLRKLKLYGNQRYHGFPEFALYECDTCHHSIEPGRALRSNFTGLPRLNDVHLRLVGTILAATDTALFKDWQQTAATLHKSPTNRTATIARLERLLAETNKRISQPDFWQPDRVRSLERILLNPQGPVYLADFDTARQVVMALGTLQAQQTNRDTSINYNNLDDLYKAVSQRKSYSPQAFNAQRKQLLGTIKP